ncbi:MAG: hypothetical protein ACK5HY_11870 [Parahaliea sp.]
MRGAAGRQRGVALAIVVWFVAAMSLLVAGIVALGRTDIRLAQSHVAQAKAEAAGDGAMQLMLARYFAARGDAGDTARVLSGSFRLGGVPVRVALVPASGLVDIRSAPLELLAALFRVRGGLDGGEARRLAEAVVQLRSRRTGGLPQQVAPEDLLRVPGFSRTLLDAVRDDIRAVEAGSRALRWDMASTGMLDALSELDSARATAILGQRDRAGGGEALARLAAAENLFRVDAMVSYGDNIWLRRRWVSLQGGGGHSALPWSYVRTEAPRVVGAGSGNGD